MDRHHGRDPQTGERLEIEVADGVITEIARRPDRSVELPFLGPGLVDLQVNGFAGADVNADTGGPELLAQITASLARIGVTTWIPTIITADEERIHHRLRRIAAARSADPDVARAIPFAHLEGPFIDAADGPRGAHPREHVRPIDAAEVRRWQRSGPVGYVTVSPHEPGAPAAIADIVGSGVAVAIGHTAADQAQIRAAVDAGATLATHVGNGIAASLPRHPNPIWSLLAEDRLSCGFIADGHHLPAETLSVMLRAVGPERAFLVSDAVELAGCPPGHYRTAVGGEVESTVDGRLVLAESGLLAGAARSLADGLGYLVAGLGLSLAEALPLVTARPGRIVGRCGGADVGTLQVGSPADLVEFDDAGAVLGVVRAGRRLV